MKKLLLSVFCMMLVCMAVVLSFTAGVRALLTASGESNPDAFYAVSIAGGFIGLIIFALLLNLFIVRRLKRISEGVKQIAKGNYDVCIKDRGKDEIREISDEFNNMAKELKANEFLNREFVRTVSHELKTPIGNIAGYAQLMKAPDVDLNEKQRYAETIYAEAMKTLELGAHMIELSRLNSTERIEKDDVYRLDEQVREIILSFQDVWTKKDVEIEVDLEPVEIKSNKNLLYHVFQNLISNAVKYVDDNGKIRVSLRKEGNVKFYVSNTGEGIKQNDLPYIYNQFYVCDRKNKNTGSGLGLCIVKRIIDKLGGTISCESKEGKITEFFVEL